LKRATIVGETTAGGAHMGRGLQRLSPLFTAFIPTGMSVNPITKTNWEAVGIEPDVRVPQDAALQAAYKLALQKLIEHEVNKDWQDGLRRALAQISAGQ
jgi:C-terminal processing protease CtpA/Prc